VRHGAKEYASYDHRQGITHQTNNVENFFMASAAPSGR